MSRALDWLKQIASDQKAGSSSASRNRVRNSESGAITVLAVSVSETECSCVEQVASVSGWEKAFAGTCQEAEELLANRQFAVILVDRDLPNTDWRVAIEGLAKIAPESCSVLISAVNDEYLWREVIQRGGFDVISKPLKPDQLRRRIDDAWLFWKSRVARQPATPGK